MDDEKNGQPVPPAASTDPNDAIESATASSEPSTNVAPIASDAPASDIVVVQRLPHQLADVADPSRLQEGDASDEEPQLRVGDHVAAITPDGAGDVHAVVIPLDPLEELLRLAGEIRVHVGASVHHLVTELEQKAAELRAHL